MAKKGEVCQLIDAAMFLQEKRKELAKTLVVTKTQRRKDMIEHSIIVIVDGKSERHGNETNQIQNKKIGKMLKSKQILGK